VYIDDLAPKQRLGQATPHCTVVEYRRQRYDHSITFAAVIQDVTIEGLRSSVLLLVNSGKVLLAMSFCCICATGPF
jgi:hypothetical protein